MEGNAAPSLHLLWSPLKMPLRELVVIRTHDSLITLLRSSRNAAQGVERSRGRGGAERPEVQMQGGQRGLGLGHKLDAVNNRMCIAFLVVSSVSLLKWLFITVWREDEQPYAKEGHESAGFHPSQTH